MKTRVASLAVFLLIAATLLAVPYARGQPGGNQNGADLAAIRRNMTQNMLALGSYGFQRRTAVQVNGEPKGVTLVQVDMSPNRQPVITQLGGEPTTYPTGGPLMQKLKERESNEIQGKVQQLVQLADQYISLDREGMQKFFEQSRVLVNREGGVIRLDTSGFRQPGDRMTIVCDRNTMRQLETNVSTTAFGKLVTIVAQYQTLPSGITYNVQTLINVPADHLQITINTFNYWQQYIPKEKQ